MPLPPDHDPVSRKKRFEHAHPNVKFTPPCTNDPKWKVRWHGDKEIAAIELPHIMDMLERLFPPPAEAPAGISLPVHPGRAGTERE